MTRTLICALVISCLAPIVRAQDTAPLRTQSGLVSGTAASVPGVTAYLGIPYAAPPVGPLRWREPQPAPSWSGVRRADTFGTSCMQAKLGSRLPWTEEYMTQNEVGEDCLSLNVWRPSGAATRLPVMVWIYGGGFNEGSSAVEVYDGASLASMGVVLVSLNYRTGVLGGLAHPELSKESSHGVSGNYGILDQIAALRWVQANIAAFGGDPANVTVFGQSAGAMSVAALMRSPLAKGLFVRAIGLAGPGLIDMSGRGGTLRDREAAGLAFGQAIGATSLAALRALPASAFIPPDVNTGKAAPPAWPFDDGYVLPTEPPATQVPIMVGFTADDIGITGTPEERVVARARARARMDRWAAEQAPRSGTVYTYYFDRVTPWPEHPEFGAHHTSEVPYVFRTVGRGKRAWEPIDRTVSERVSRYFVNFAKTGDPNGDGLPHWDPWSAAAKQTMRLGEPMGMMAID